MRSNEDVRLSVGCHHKFHKRCLYRVDQYLRLCLVCTALNNFGSKEVSSTPPPPEDKSSSSSSSSSSFFHVRDYCGVCASAAADQWVWCGTRQRRPKSIFPCPLFYFLKLYHKRRRPPSPSSFNPLSSSHSSSNLVEIQRSSSRSNLSSRRSISRVKDDLYDRLGNPNGVIELGLAENKLCFDLIEKWVFENLANSIIGTSGGD
ncbi:hypothetical protein TorRG33x02_118030 [Trema orientale]|uniref:Uncharacterized protein n=1 Tax=Trema orientale TaxID=63057 RepID=A0A2P5F402_TREOI|nr:hypothetical protein TorRG33x02_118030 [Trema orientale]